jgi:DNA-binding beta-propeller fold protein YncE
MASGARADEAGYADTGYYAPEDEDDLGGEAGADDGYESEVEDDFLSLQPASTNVYVFVANASRNTVSRIDVADLGVLTTEVGIDPSVVETTDDYTMAVTFNQGSDSISIIDAATLDVVEVEVRDNFNTMKMSPDGNWVICYHDADADDSSSSGGAQSFNEVSLVNLFTHEHTAMVVGFNPRDVQFSEDSTMAVVVSDAYLAVIDLIEESPSPNRIQISEDLIDPPLAEEVLLVPDGSYAFVRQFAATELVVVDILSELVDWVEVGDNPTDIDVTPDGTQAVAVARGSGELWVYDLADPYAEPEVVTLPEGEVFGSVVMSPDGSKGLLYSTASGMSRFASWDRNAEDPEESIEVRSLVKPVDSIAVSPTGGTALIFHDKSNGEDVDSGSAFYGEYALTMIDLSDFFANPLLLPAEPTGYADTEDGQTGFFVMDGEAYLEVLHYDSLLYDEVELKSDPVHLGVLPETRTAYISQEHDLGRISFYDADAEELETITGFELNAGIQD